LVFIRAVVYSTLFVSLVLIFLPGTVLARAGVRPPDGLGIWQLSGSILGACGALIALSCIVTFVVVGRGTPAPFDPPRRLVVTGPYRFVRNPMYIGAAMALAAAALFYRSWALVGYLFALAVVTHLLVTFYEEPTLRRMFGDEYRAYCAHTGRWWPIRPTRFRRSRSRDVDRRMVD
jgi:protein-S-isoprenylcysteine O-methyltransferase Ste14